jgi:hypothetical protein
VANNYNVKDFGNMHSILTYEHLSRGELGIFDEVNFGSAIRGLFGFLKNLII